MLWMKSVILLHAEKGHLSVALLLVERGADRGLRAFRVST